MALPPVDSNDKVIAGVCSGLARHFEMDPTVMRLLWVLIAVITAAVPVLLIYLILAIVMPKA